MGRPTSDRPLYTLSVSGCNSPPRYSVILNKKVSVNWVPQETGRKFEDPVTDRIPEVNDTERSKDSCTRPNLKVGTTVLL